MHDARKNPIERGRHPSRIPTYPIGDAARWLALPASTVRAWCLGQPQRSGPVFRPVIEVADVDGRLLSFQDLVEVHVLAAIRKQHGVTLQNVRKAVRFMRKELGIEHPLAHREMLTDGKDLFLRQFGSLVNVSREGQNEMQDLLEAYLKRIVHESSGLPVRLFPFTTGRVEGDSRSVSVDPRHQFGRPCLFASGIPTEVIADRYRGGESMESIARDYRCPRAEVEEAVRYELVRAA